jgi:hypothetical protein
MQAIEEAAATDASANPVRLAHPLTLIRIAYGL